MRMRKKPNLIPRMERCAAVLVKNPEEHRGRWLTSFPGYTSLAVELGCGKGAFTAGTAELHPDTLFIAVERVPDAMVVAMERVTEKDLKNVRFIDMDAAGLRGVFAPGEADRLYVNFPDPWPRSKQAKRRLTHTSFLNLYREMLRPGGELHFKTDNDELFAYSLDSFRENGWELREVTNDLHEHGPVGVMTDSEAKFVAQGVRINRCVAVPIPGSPVTKDKEDG